MKLVVFRPEKLSFTDVDVELTKKPGKGLGLSVVGRQSGKGAYVSEIVSTMIKTNSYLQTVKKEANLTQH